MIRISVVVLLAVAIAIVMPSGAGREIHLRLLWERTPEDGAAQTGRAGSGVQTAAGEQPLLLLGDGAYLRVDPATGALLREGLRAAVFSASPTGLVNLPSDGERIAVEGWGGELLLSAPRLGTPRLYGSLLADVAPGQVAIYDLSQTGEGAVWVPSLPRRPTVFDLESVGGEIVMAVGTITGRVSLSGNATGEVVRQLPDPPLDTDVPIVYAIEILSADALAIVAGSHAPYLAVLDRAGGGLVERWRLAIDSAHALRSPTRIDELASEVLLVAVPGALLVVESGAVRAVAAPGVDVSGGGVASGQRFFVAGWGERSSVVAVAATATDAPVAWTFAGTRVQVAGPGEAPVAVLSSDGIVSAIEVVW